MNSCIEEGTLQAWFDGELAANEAAKVAAHLNICAACAGTASTVEAESLILSEALAAEFTATVPTEALRQRVDAAVAGFHQTKVPVSASHWSTFTQFFGSFRPLAYASVAAMVVVVAIVGFVYFKNQKINSVANTNNAPIKNPAAPQQSPQQVKNETPEQIKNPTPPESPYIAVDKTPKRIKQNKPVEPDGTSLAWQQRQYETAIAKLNDALKTQPPMRPSLQVEYEYNMAVIDNAIATTRDAARKNPKDPLANQFMLSAYQSKVDFMNQIADARGLEK